MLGRVLNKPLKQLHQNFKRSWQKDILDFLDSRFSKRYSRFTSEGVLLPFEILNGKPLPHKEWFKQRDLIIV